jgi:hypothetical protein
MLYSSEKNKNSRLHAALTGIYNLDGEWLWAVRPESLHTGVLISP